MPDTGGWKHIKKEECPHIADLKEGTTSDSKECAVCKHTEDLRICLARLPDGQVCGYVACCESHSAHNTEHFKETEHPFIKPHNSEYNWLWCYKCNAFLE